MVGGNVVEEVKRAVLLLRQADDDVEEICYMHAWNAIRFNLV